MTFEELMMILFPSQATFILILWFIPTFVWPGEPLPVAPVPTNNNREGNVVTERIERIGALFDNLGGANPVTVYNRLMCPRCVVQTLSIMTLLVRFLFLEIPFFSDLNSGHCAAELTQSV